MVAKLLAALALSVLAHGLAAQDPAPPAPRIAVLYWSMKIPGQVAMRAGLEAELKAENAARKARGAPEIIATYEVAGDGPKGIERQVVQMREAIAAKPDLIIVQPTDNAALGAPLVEANKANIPVVAYDQYISRGQLTAFLTSDNEAAGYLDGEYIASLFPSEQELRLIIVDYPQVSSTVERVDGFLAALKERKQRHRIVANYQAVEPVSGAKAGADILRDFPEKGSVDVVFTVNDGGGLAVVEALAKAGRDEIAVATIDGDARSIENIKKGRLTRIDCAQFCGELGRQTMKVAARVLAGEKVARLHLIPVFPITRETHGRFLGWNRGIPEPFEKPWPSATPKWRWSIRVED